jgi:hypothetical protein
METKLTLRLNKTVIEKAKEYALSHNISLSRMVETYFKSITVSKKGLPEITPLVESLSGVIQNTNDLDYKEGYSAFLNEKYK